MSASSVTAHHRALTALKEAQKESSKEYAHMLADGALCDLLESLGYADVVAEYHKIEKWFA